MYSHGQGVSRSHEESERWLRSAQQQGSTLPCPEEGFLVEKELDVVISEQVANLVEQLEKALGPDHLDVATSLGNYAAMLRQVGRTQKAARMEARAKAIRAKYK